MGPVLNYVARGNRREANDLAPRVLYGAGAPGFFRAKARAQIGNNPLLSTRGKRARPSSATSRNQGVSTPVWQRGRSQKWLGSLSEDSDRT